MVNERVTAAILLAVVAVVAAGEDGHQFRQWVHECRREFPANGIGNKSEPLWAVKKTITGMYDPRTHHAFRKSVLTIAKFESAIISDPKEAEKCMVNCIAEKLRWINGTTQQINSSRVFEGTSRFAEKFNMMARHKRIDTSKLKRYVSKCITGTSGVYEKKCEKGYELMRCVHTAIVESMYDVLSTPVPTSTAASWPETTEQPSAPERLENNAAYRPPPHTMYVNRRPFHRFGPPPPMPLSGPPPPPPMGMAPPPGGMGMGMGRPMTLQAVPMAQPLPLGGPEPAMIAYGQRSGVVEVFGRRRYGQPWRETPYKK